MPEAKHHRRLPPGNDACVCGTANDRVRVTPNDGSCVEFIDGACVGAGGGPPETFDGEAGELPLGEPVSGGGV